MRTEWLLCPAAHAEAKRTGLVVACDAQSQRHHVCDGERTPYLWDARGPNGEPFQSKEPCCSSCIGDYEGGYYAEPGMDEACCCTHGAICSAERKGAGE